ncbi:VIT domain-containing protein [Falsiroseomonas sp. HW251]|uniref:VIT domain-containing protein n=1 Tax=Falsiroseomonas sp. HW251 TaxID=3390998 RepID=UPI003D321E7E
MQSADPLGRYRHLATDGAGRPIPLAATRFSVRILGGLAFVTAERSFRNAEASSIEATMTFPVPLHAALIGLTADIEGRKLTGRARSRMAARDHYEAGIAKGRAAVLHEEVLRGVHMISVGQIRPGGEAAVAGLFVVPLAAASGGNASLRIPTTVSDIYGRSPLPDSDDLVHGPVLHEAELEVSCLDGGASATLLGGRLEGGRARVRLDAPIEILMTGAALGIPLVGMAADGRPVELTVGPAPIGDDELNATWLLDISGSMVSPALREDGAPGPSKYEVALCALADISNRISGADRIALWEFSDTSRRIGEATGPAGVRELIRHVSPLQGGTEIGGAIAACTRDRATSDVLIVTDGQTYALDVQVAARLGARFTVVLVGEDALAANVGHLAALTGGQVFISSGPDLPGVIEMAVASMRAPRRAAAYTESGRPTEAAAACAGGMLVEARWSPRVAEGLVAEPTDQARAVGAYAAWLALPSMAEADAAALAEAEGIVSHLTSLVLVDDAGEAQDAIPAQRKVLLTTPRVACAPIARAVDCAPVLPSQRVASPAVGPASAGSMNNLFRRASGLMRRELSESAPPRSPPAAARIAAAEEMGMDIPTFLRRQSNDRASAFRAPPPTAPARRSSSTPSIVDLSVARGRIGWGAEPERLRAGDLSGLPAGLVAALLRAAEVDSVKSVAGALGVPPVVIVLALVARIQSHWDTAARRFADAVLDRADRHAVTACSDELGL